MDTNLTHETALALAYAQEPGTVLLSDKFLPLRKLSKNRWLVYNAELQSLYSWTDQDAALFIIGARNWVFM